MTVLGWTLDDIPPPDGIGRNAHQGVFILQADAANPRRHLQHHLRILQCGIDVLPTAPARPMGLRQAQELVAEGVISPLLRALRGKRQFTLALSRPDEVAAVARNGRSWLQDRRLNWEQDTARSDLLLMLAQRAALPMSPLRCTAGTFQCDVLCDHLDAARLEQDLRAALVAIQPSGDVKILLTGPWPPFGFCQIPPLDAAA